MPWHDKILPNVTSYYGKSWFTAMTAKDDKM